MATNAPLLGGNQKKGHSKASIFYGADEYLEETSLLQMKFGVDMLPPQDKMLKVEKNNENRLPKVHDIAFQLVGSEFDHCFLGLRMRIRG
eukprot:Skav221658  [mRNA]  locus=scaffold1750:184949:186257:+ [translate_table: standard]